MTDSCPDCDAVETHDAEGPCLPARLVEHTADIITVLNPDGCVRFQSRSAEELLGRPAKRRRHSLFANTHPEDVPAAKTAWALVRRRPNARHTVELRTRHEDGTWRVMEAHLVNRLDDPAIAGVVVTRRDITDRKSLETRLKHATRFDELTGLPNRYHFVELVSEQLAADVDLAVVLINIDRFGHVNAELGHAGGDRVLAMVADRLATASPDAVLARFGGDCFAVMTELVDGMDPQAFGDELRAAVRPPFEHHDHPYSITLSVGVARSDGAGGSAPALLQRADAALTAARELGRDRAVVAPGEAPVGYGRSELGAALGTAVATGAIDVHYQPVVDVESGDVRGFEALARWKHPRLGSVPPARFIPIAEQSDLILELGALVLGKACALVGSLETNGWRTPPTVSVNVSARQLACPELLDDVEAALRAADLEPGRLVLEITESVLATAEPATVACLQQLRRRGIRIAVDDFGTGYSSLAQLSRLPVDVLKIDRSFLQRLGRGRHDTQLVRTIIDMARALDLEVVAEGVQHREQVEALVAMGCAKSQGYFWSAGVAGDRVTDTVRRLRGALADTAGMRHRALGARLNDVQSMLVALQHEIRTPLTAMRWALPAIDGRQLDEPARTALESVTQSLASVDATLEHFTREAGLRPPQRYADRVSDLIRVVTDAVDGLRPMMDRKTVVVRTPSGDAQVPGAPDELRRAVVNLLANADRFAPPGTPVEVEVGLAGGRWVVSVIDHGTGVGDEETELIFEPHYRTAALSVGNGLGLHLSRQTARRLGGDLTYRHTPGGGATFSLELPDVGRVPIAPEASAVLPGPGHGAHFYRSDGELVIGAVNHLAAGFGQGALMLLVVTPAHRLMIEAALTQRGIPLGPDDYLALDPHEVLAALRENGRFRAERVWDAIAPVLEASQGRYLYAYGVAAEFLVEEDLQAGLAFEAAWGDIVAQHPAAVLCAHRRHDDHAAAIVEIETAHHYHTTVIA